METSLIYRTMDDNEQENSFSSGRLCTWTRFETEARAIRKWLVYTNTILPEQGIRFLFVFLFVFLQLSVKLVTLNIIRLFNAVY